MSHLYRGVTGAGSLYLPRWGAQDPQHTGLQQGTLCQGHPQPRNGDRRRWRWRWRGGDGGDWLLCPAELTVTSPFRAHPLHRCQQWRQKFGCCPRVWHGSHEFPRSGCPWCPLKTSAPSTGCIWGKPSFQASLPALAAACGSLGGCGAGFSRWCLVHGWHLPAVPSALFSACTAKIPVPRKVTLEAVRCLNCSFNCARVKADRLLF